MVVRGSDGATLGWHPSNQVVGGSNPSGRATIFCIPEDDGRGDLFGGGHSNRRQKTSSVRQLGRRPSWTLPRSGSGLERRTSGRRGREQSVRARHHF